MSNVSVWGWQQYFAELAQFLGHANRNLGVADEDFSSNVMERLQVHRLHRFRSIYI